MNGFQLSGLRNKVDGGIKEKDGRMTKFPEGYKNSFLDIILCETTMIHLWEGIIQTTNESGGQRRS